MTDIVLSWTETTIDTHWQNPSHTRNMLDITVTGNHREVRWSFLIITNFFYTINASINTACVDRSQGWRVGSKAGGRLNCFLSFSLQSLQ